MREGRSEGGTVGGREGVREGRWEGGKKELRMRGGEMGAEIMSD